MKAKASILIVDDNISLCKTMSFVLKRKGYDVAITEGGQEAIEKVKEKPFDIIFMDIKMPLMNGVEAYKEIKMIRPEAVVIMMTAYAVEELIQEALWEGAFGVIYKPLDIEKILALIKEAREIKEGALILVVDDDPSTCITMKNILIKKGYKVAVANTGEEAIAIVRGQSYDIIFIDIKLPTINGLETYLAIKEINPEVVAIMMTAFRQEMSDLVDEALKKDAYTCIYKPFDMAETLGLVERIIEKKQKVK